MNPADFINNTDKLIKQMGISIKDAYTGDDDATQNALSKWCNSSLNIHHKTTGGIIFVNQQKQPIALTCICLSKDSKKKTKRNNHCKHRTKSRLAKKHFIR